MKKIKYYDLRDAIVEAEKEALISRLFMYKVMVDLEDGNVYTESVRDQNSMSREEFNGDVICVHKAYPSYDCIVNAISEDVGHDSFEVRDYIDDISEECGDELVTRYIGWAFANYGDFFDFINPDHFTEYLFDEHYDVFERIVDCIMDNCCADLSDAAYEAINKLPDDFEVDYHRY